MAAPFQFVAGTALKIAIIVSKFYILCFIYDICCNMYCIKTANIFNSYTNSIVIDNDSVDTVGPILRYCLHLHKLRDRAHLCKRLEFINLGLISSNIKIISSLTLLYCIVSVIMYAIMQKSVSESEELRLTNCALTVSSSALSH